MAHPRTPYDNRLGRKTCTKCKVEKPYPEFSKRRNRKHGLMSMCKECDNSRRANADVQYKRRWYEARRGKLLDRGRFLKYGVSVEEYQAMLREQDGKCAICRQPERALNKRGELRQLAIDHDHQTNHVRGLLCTACNIGLGNFGDNEDLLIAALDYLQARRQHLRKVK